VAALHLFPLDFVTYLNHLIS